MALTTCDCLEMMPRMFELRRRPISLLTAPAAVGLLPRHLLKPWGERLSGLRLVHGSPAAQDYQLGN